MLIRRQPGTALAAFLTLAVLLGSPAISHAVTAPKVVHSQPMPDAARRVYRLAWVEEGTCLRSGAVIVNGDHLAEGKKPEDALAVLREYTDLKTKFGLAAVVNLRDEADEDRAAAKKLGMSYLYLPIPDGSAPSPVQVEKFFGFVDGARRRKQVVLWHCAGGIGRTGFFAAVHRLRSGWSVEDAAREMFEMGLSHNQAAEHLPALNAYAAALKLAPFYPAGWTLPKKSPFDYTAIAKKLGRQLPPTKKR